VCVPFCLFVWSGRIGSGKLLLALASTGFLGSSPAGPMTIFYCLTILRVVELPSSCPFISFLLNIWPIFSGYVMAIVSLVTFTKTYNQYKHGGGANLWSRVKEETIILSLLNFLWVIFGCYHWLDYIASNYMTINGWWIGKNLEGSGRGLFEVLSQHLSGETEENHEIP
jgi:hypothetical protein